MSTIPEVNIVYSTAIALPGFTNVAITTTFLIPEFIVNIEAKTSGRILVGFETDPANLSSPSNFRWSRSPLSTQASCSVGLERDSVLALVEDTGLFISASGNFVSSTPTSSFVFKEDVPVGSTYQYQAYVLAQFNAVDFRFEFTRMFAVEI